MSDDKKLVVAQQEQPVQMPSIFQSPAAFEFAQRAARALACSELVPERYRVKNSGETAVGNCLIAMDMANRVGMNPLLVMQNLYVVHGNPGWSAQYIRAAINSSGKFSIPQYEFFGKEGQDDYGCRAYAAVIATGEVIKGPKVTIGMAKKEGWWGKNGSKWPNMTDIMLQNRAITFFGRTYCPEVLMGMQSAEELEDIKDVNPIDGQRPMSKADIHDALVGDAVVTTETVVDERKSEPAKQQEQVAEQVVQQQGREPGSDDDKTEETASSQSSGTNPFTADELIARIEAATTIDEINDTLACTTGFDRDARSRVMKAAAAKNKAIVAARDKQ